MSATQIPTNDKPGDLPATDKAKEFDKFDKVNKLEALAQAISAPALPPGVERKLDDLEIEFTDVYARPDIAEAVKELIQKLIVLTKNKQVTSLLSTSFAFACYCLHFYTLSVLFSSDHGV